LPDRKSSSAVLSRKIGGPFLTILRTDYHYLQK
jgi:hypothetical protein